MKKALFVSNHIGFLKFNIPFIRWFVSQGWEVDNAAPGFDGDYADVIHEQIDIPISRSPISLSNIRAIARLRKLLKENKYDLIHCHTPMGGVVSRLAAIPYRKNTKIIYTAHGFHFFKGSSILSWLVYFPIELLLSHLTDAVVTINEEDYALAGKFRLARGNVFKINGVGCDRAKFHPLSSEEKSELRKSFGFDDNDFIVLYVAQFIKRKNHTMLLNAVPEFLKRNARMKFVFVGDGPDLEKSIAEANALGVKDSVRFLGWQDSVSPIYGMSDIHLSTSLQEGLSINNIEAMSCGLPLVISDIRGHTDTCVPGRNGFLFDLSDSAQMMEQVIALSCNRELYEDISRHNIEDSAKFSSGNAVAAMATVYSEVLGPALK